MSRPRLHARRSSPFFVQWIEMWSYFSRWQQSPFSLRKQFRWILLLVAIWLASSWSLFHPQFFRVHDFTHAARIAEFARAFSQGHFPVRWTSNFGYGYGMPLFEFYAPLPYGVGALIWGLGVPMYWVLVLIFGLSSALTALGAYLLGKELYGEWGGVLTAAALTMAPYRALNLFVRGALSEAWGIMAMPWILLGLVWLSQRRPRGWLVLVLGLVTLMLSHNITTLLFIPVSLLWWLGWYVVKGAKAKVAVVTQLVQLAGCYLLAIGLSLFYLVPALWEKQYTQVEKIFQGYFHYSHHFLYIRQFFQPNWGYGGSAWGPHDGISFFFGWGQWVGVTLAMFLGIMVLVRWRQSKNDNSLWSVPELIIWLGWLGFLSFIASYMTLLKSQPIWQSLSVLAYVQFPWRFLSIVIMMVALLVGMVPVLWEGLMQSLSSTNSITKKLKWLHSSKVKTGIFSSLLALIVVSNASYFSPEKYLTKFEDFYYTDPTLIQKQMSSILPDYIPATMGEVKEPPDRLFWVPGGLDRFVEVVINRGHQKLVKTQFANEVLLSLAIANYPGWQAEIDGQPTQIVGGRVAGTIGVNVPPGEHLVGVWFGYTPVRLISDSISALCLVLLLGLLVEFKRGATHD